MIGLVGISFILVMGLLILIPKVSEVFLVQFLGWVGLATLFFEYSMELSLFCGSLGALVLSWQYQLFNQSVKREPILRKWWHWLMAVFLGVGIGAIFFFHMPTEIVEPTVLDAWDSFSRGHALLSGEIILFFAALIGFCGEITRKKEVAPDE